MSDAMSSAEMVRLCREHTFYTWSRQGGLHPTPVARAERIYFWTPDGKRYTDFNAQAMSVNIGHHHPRVIAAMKAQADSLVYAHAHTATAVRARLGKLLAELTPDPINTFLFTLGGAEANENAVRAARLMTGRPKIVTRYRSYHGGTNLTINLTGDPRRWLNEPSPPGIVRVLDPEPYTYSFGDDQTQKTTNNLRYFEEVIAMEGPSSIAAVLVETVTGSNGVLPPPPGYLEGLRALCDRHGILLICDEVMAGFGRTGRLYGFQHTAVVPDLITCAKGLTSSYLPLGFVGFSDKVAAFFQGHVFMGGLTYNAHPMSLAAAEANIQVLLDEGMIANAARLEAVLHEAFAAFKLHHPTFKAGRAIGLMGMIDLQKNAAGAPLAPFNGTSEAMRRFGEALDDAGIYTALRWNTMTCMPPLCITEAELRETLAVIDRCLEVTHPFFEG